MFSGTLRDNIRYGKLEATDDEIRAALDLIGAKEFGSRLDEEVGEEGSNFSLGERQLVSFARCVLKDPRILIMDEATSSVDALAEAKIQSGIDKLIKGEVDYVITDRYQARLTTLKNNIDIPMDYTSIDNFTRNVYLATTKDSAWEKVFPLLDQELIEARETGYVAHLEKNYLLLWQNKKDCSESDTK